MKKIYDTIENKEPILKGLSGDNKYCVTAYDGTKYFLRILPIEKFDLYENLFGIQKRLDILGVPMSKPVEFGTCTDGAYTLSSWIHGENANIVLPKLNEAEQYKLGVKSGEILRLIHSIPAPENEEDWETKTIHRIDIKIKKYKESEKTKFNGGENFIKYIEQNRHLLNKSRPQCYLHGDYQLHNMMIENGELRIVDFGIVFYGDAWNDLTKIRYSAQISPHFSMGQLYGYFGGEPPLEFFKLFALYTSERTLLAIEWASPHGQEVVSSMMKLIEDTLSWHDNMNNPIPSWYLNYYN